MAECYASTTVNIATALGFFSRMCSLQSLEMIESEHQFVTALRVECYKWSRSTSADGRLVLRRRWVSRELSLQFANECETSGGIGDGQSVWKPLPITHGNSGGIHSEGID